MNERFPPTILIQIFGHLLTTDGFEESWIQTIPFLIHTAGIEIDEMRTPQRKYLGHYQYQHHTFKIMKQIVLKITKPIHLEMLLFKEMNFMTYLKWIFHPESSHEETVWGLELMVHFQSIDHFILKRNSFQWLREKLQELQSCSKNEDIFALVFLLGVQSGPVSVFDK
jgi:hypothetical protein